MNMRYEQGFCGNEIRFIPTKPFFVSIGLQSERGLRIIHANKGRDDFNVSTYEK